MFCADCPFNFQFHFHHGQNDLLDIRVENMWLSVCSQETINFLLFKNILRKDGKKEKQEILPNILSDLSNGNM